MENEILKSQVYDLQVGGVPETQAIADMLEDIDNGKIEKEKFEMKIATYKQLNNRQKNIIDAQRVELKIREFKQKNVTDKTNNINNLKTKTMESLTTEVVSEYTINIFQNEIEQEAIMRIIKFSKIAESMGFNIALGFSGG